MPSNCERDVSISRGIGGARERTNAPITKGMQNHVLFFTSRHTWMNKRMNMTIAAMTPAAMVGVYGQSTYSGTAEESSAVDDILRWRLCGGSVDAFVSLKSKERTLGYKPEVSSVSSTLNSKVRSGGKAGVVWWRSLW